MFLHEISLKNFHLMNVIRDVTGFYHLLVEKISNVSMHFRVKSLVTFHDCGTTRKIFLKGGESFLSGIEYIRPKDITVKDLAEAASTILPRLFINEPYSENEKCIYQYICHRNMEDFIDRELFTYAGVIIFEVPDTVRESEILYRFATVYFLHSRHNAKLKRGTPEKYNMEVIDDWLYDLVRVAARKCCKDWEQKKELVPDKEKFFKLFKKLSFVFEDSNVCYIWNGTNYFEEKDNDCIQIKLGITVFNDEIKNYDELILSLLTKKRNGIANYRNSAIFWRHVMQIRRGQDRYLLEKNNAPDTDILMFVLALAMDTTIYNLLQSKKSELTLPARTFRYPYIGKDEKQILIERLQYAGEHLRIAIEHTNDTDDIYSVPRRMLFDANLYLLQKGKRPIIPLKGEEVTEVKKHISKKTLNEFYNEDTLSDDKNETQIEVLRLNLPIL